MHRRRLLGLVGAGAAGVLLDACRAAGTVGPGSSGAAPAPSPVASTTAAPATTALSGHPTSVPSAASAGSDQTKGPPAGWVPGQPATYVDHGPGGVADIALTFHLGGQRSLVTKLLDVLKGNGVNATLFAIGQWLTANPDLGHRAVADGHELGNHTLHHLDMPALDRATVHAEIEGGAQALVPFIGDIGRWFRPSGTVVPGQVILDEAGRVGYPVSVGYDVDSTDNTEPGSRRVIDIVSRGMHPGAIVSLHFGHQDTIDALPSILEHASGAGLRPVTVSTLLG